MTEYTHTISRRQLLNAAQAVLMLAQRLAWLPERTWPPRCGGRCLNST